MKTKTLALLCSLPWTAAAQNAPSDIQAKAGYFFFTSSKMKDVFDKGGIDTQISGAYGFYHWLRVCGSVEYLQKSGYSLNAHQPTSIWEIPLSLGLQPYFNVRTFSDRKLDCYFTLGPRYVFAHVHNHSGYVSRIMNQNGIAGFANVGVRLSISDVGFDAFGEYSYCKLHFHSSHRASEGHAVQIGGLALGGAVGYVF
jgi:hypothetical protein